MATQWNYDFSPGEVLTAGVMDSLGAVSESYTPVWGASGTAPSLGNGSLTGRYFRINKMVFVQILFIAGSTSTFGTGHFTFSVPFNARAGLFGFMSNGVYRNFDASAGLGYQGQTGFFAGEIDRIVLYQPSGSLVGNTSPFTWASTDEALATLWYEAA
jgi:hypothetical protein